MTESLLDKARELMERGWSARRAGKLAEARRDLTEAIALFNEAEDHTYLVMALGRLGHVEMDQQRWEAAQDVYERGIDICIEAGDLPGLAHKTRHLGDVFRHADRLQKARQHYHQALSIYRRLEEPPHLDYANALMTTGLLEADMGPIDEAIVLLSEARELYERIGLQEGVDECATRVNDMKRRAEGPVLSRETESRLSAMFGGPEAVTATRLLVERCGRNLPLMGDKQPEAIERIRIAALKASSGDLDELRKAVDLANVDWRDLLVAAGFAHDVTAHKRWHPE